jgi:RNA polymerase sigma-70 factor (ECF subfamily)
VTKSGLDEILRRAARREPEALGQLVDMYSTRVFGLLYRLTGSRAAAEDLLQDTFLRVVRMIDRYQHVGKFEPWLFRIAANLARDRARQAARHAPPISTAELPLDDGRVRAARGGAADDPAVLMARSDTAERLADCLCQLSEAEREIILLRHYSGLSFREIADLLGIPLGTGLARAHRALQRLREMLADED